MSDPTAGGTGGDPSGGNSPPTVPGVVVPPPPAPPAQPQFTQEDLDRTVGARVAEAQRQATRKLVEELGFGKVEDLKTLVQAQRDAEKAQMTETDRLKAEAATAAAEAKADRQAAAQERHALSVERELSKAGAQGDLTLLARLVEVEVGADQAALAAAVTGVKEKMPTLFGSNPSLPSTQAVGGGSPVRNPLPTSDPMTLGADKAKAYESGQRTGF